MTEELEKEELERGIELLRRQFYPNIAEWIEKNHPSMQEDE